MTITFDEAATAVENHHEDLRDRLVWRTEALICAVADRRPYESAYQDLVEFLDDELLPHMEVEAGLLFTAGGNATTALLIAAMQEEHRMMTTLVREIERASNAMDLAIATGSLVVLFDVCAHQEDRYLVPALTEAGVDLGTLVENAPEIVGAISEA
ncbi:hypothetical protein [Blastococcus sp. TF02A-30]|uniref:hypothetical protein n=1 Tax=Blastococcus sp. TF02A-30 TaxID=2250580 RepID=UPI000DE8CE65|nr:hypothetical protein [Blastococcus sp. TF02A-30]RBY84929.1 hypothetical protein DQ241_16610 [Blastococcus sp. TF02A-30]